LTVICSKCSFLHIFFLLAVHRASCFWRLIWKKLENIVSKCVGNFLFQTHFHPAPQANGKYWWETIRQKERSLYFSSHSPPSNPFQMGYDFLPLQSPRSLLGDPPAMVSALDRKLCHGSSIWRKAQSSQFLLPPPDFYALKSNPWLSYYLVLGFSFPPLSVNISIY
jgi:hypothetical protein